MIDLTRYPNYYPVSTHEPFNIIHYYIKGGGRNNPEFIEEVRRTLSSDICESIFDPLPSRNLDIYQFYRYSLKPGGHFKNDQVSTIFDMYDVIDGRLIPSYSEVFASYYANDKIDEHSGYFLYFIEDADIVKIAKHMTSDTVRHKFAEIFSFSQRWFKIDIEIRTSIYEALMLSSEEACWLANMDAELYRLFLEDFSDGNYEKLSYYIEYAWNLPKGLMKNIATTKLAELLDYSISHTQSYDNHNSMSINEYDAELISQCLKTKSFNEVIENSTHNIKHEILNTLMIDKYSDDFKELFDYGPAHPKIKTLLKEPFFYHKRCPCNAEESLNVHQFNKILTCMRDTAYWHPSWTRLFVALIQKYPEEFTSMDVYLSFPHVPSFLFYALQKHHMEYMDICNITTLPYVFDLTPQAFEDLKLYYKNLNEPQEHHTSAFLSIALDKHATFLELIQCIKSFQLKDVSYEEMPLLM